MQRLRQLFPALIILTVAAPLLAAPVSTLSPKEARNRIASAAEAYRGVPYRFGGTSREGLDCSGLVYVSLYDSMGIRVPRTVRTLKSWTEPLSRSQLQVGDLVFFDTTGPLAHVGIYLGSGRFIHSASAGADTGVIVSSLDEAYWRRSYAAAGRIVPSADYLGVLVSLSGGLTGLDGPGDSWLRGLAFSADAEYELLGLKPGVEIRPEWDAVLGVLRVPLTFSIGIGEEFRLFVGPALVLGDPELAWDGGRRSYSPAGGVFATGGLRWVPYTFSSGNARISPFGEVAWQRYEPAAEEAEDPEADAAANFRASIGVRFRWEL